MGVASPRGTAAARSPDVREGTVQRFTAGQEGREQVVRFVLDTGDRLVAVEMRGDELRGIISDGDRVSVTPTGGDDGTLRPRELANLTTNAHVEMWQAPFRLRAARFVGVSVATATVSAVVSALVGLTFAAVFATKAAPPGKPGPAPPNRVGGSAGNFDYVALIAALAAGAVLVLIYFWLASRRRRPIRAAVIAGLALGAVAVGLVLALV